MGNRKLSSLDKFLIDYAEESDETFAKSPLTLRHLLFSLPELKTSNLATLLDKRWDDIEVIDGIQTIFGALYSLNRVMKPHQIYRYFTNVISILGSGIQGEASSSTFKTIKPNNSKLLAIKIVNDPTDGAAVNDLIQEFFVCRTLEKIANETPIFIKSYGLMNCSKSYESDDRGDLGYCARDIPISIVTQFIPGQMIYNMRISAEEFFKCFLLFIFGLKAAEKLRFTHHDPHIGNVIYRRLPARWSFPARWKNQTYWIQANLIPVLLDYGLARIDTKNGPLVPTGLGPDRLRNNRITPEYAPMHDVYKYLFFIFTTNKPLFEEFSFIGKFFHPNLTWEYVQRVIKPRNSIVPDQLRFRTLDTFITYLFENLPSRYRFDSYLSSTPGNYHIYGQYSDKINIFTEIGLDLRKYHSLTDTYQWYLYRKLPGKKLESKELITDLVRIIPGQVQNYFRFLDETINNYLPYWIEKFKTPLTIQKLRILGYIGDIVSSINIEKRTIGTAMRDLLASRHISKNSYEEYQKSLNEKITRIQELLSVFQPVYQSYFKGNLSYNPNNKAEFEIYKAVKSEINAIAAPYIE